MVKGSPWVGRGSCRVGSRGRSPYQKRKLIHYPQFPSPSAGEGEGEGEGEKQRSLARKEGNQTQRPSALTPALSRWEREARSPPSPPVGRAVLTASSARADTAGASPYPRATLTYPAPAQLRRPGNLHRVRPALIARRGQHIDLKVAHLPRRYESLLREVFPWRILCGSGQHHLIRRVISRTGTPPHLRLDDLRVSLGQPPPTLSSHRPAQMA